MNKSEAWKLAQRHIAKKGITELVSVKKLFELFENLRFCIFTDDLITT